MHPRTPAPGPRLSLRILTEDPLLLRADLALPGTDVEVVVCDGPCVGGDCPLLAQGTCPLGRFDAVVADLDRPWAARSPGPGGRRGRPSSTPASWTSRAQPPAWSAASACPSTTGGTRSTPRRSTDATRPPVATRRAMPDTGAHG